MRPKKPTTSGTTPGLPLAARPGMPDAIHGQPLAVKPEIPDTPGTPPGLLNRPGLPDTTPEVLGKPKLGAKARFEKKVLGTGGPTLKKMIVGGVATGTVMTAAGLGVDAIKDTSKESSDTEEKEAAQEEQVAEAEVAKTTGISPTGEASPEITHQLQRIASSLEKIAAAITAH